jgi:hypothetical protein
LWNGEMGKCGNREMENREMGIVNHELILLK